MTRGRHKRIRAKRIAAVSAYIALQLRELEKKAKTLCWQVDVCYPEPTPIIKGLVHELRDDIATMTKEYNKCPSEEENR